MTDQQKSRKYSRALIAAAVCGSLFAGAVSAGSIVGTAHDFTQFGWNPEGQICVFCHVPHNADTTVTNVPLWGHELTNEVYDLYTSPTFEGVTTQGQPGSNSILCLSCHDGTVAVDSYGGNSGTFFLSGPTAVGRSGDLSDDHPISFDYTTALADLDGSLWDPTTTPVTIGSGDKTKTGSITDVLLFDQRMECASCHDVHNAFVEVEDDSLLKISSNGSRICLTCHNK